jgi:hypothetical protein
MWFELKGDARLARCASENCGGQPTWRLEADGVGSDYCSGCRSRIDSNCEWVEVTDGTTLAGDRFSYIPNPETGVGQITSHKRLAARS